MSDKVAVVESGGSKFITGIVRKDSQKIIEKRRVKNDFGSAEDFLEAVSESLSDSIESSGFSEQELDGIGVASAGTWNIETGAVSPPNMSFEEDSVPLGRRISSDFDLPVFAENDVNAAVLAEQEFGYGTENSVRYLGYLTISTGIGFGIIDNRNGKLLVGESGQAPEVGHNVIVPEGLRCGCGGKGHWESYGSGEGIKRIASDISEDPDYSKTTEEILEAAREGEELEKKAVNRAAYCNAVGIGQIINSFQPGAIVVGGTPVLEYPELVLGPVKDLLYNPPERHEFTYITVDDLPDIRRTEIGEDNVALGAACVAFKSYKRNRIG